MMKIKPKERIVAYHCSCCGAPCDPDKKICDFCAMNLTIRRPKTKTRIRLKVGDQYVSNILEVGEISFVKTAMIDVTSLCDEVPKHVEGLNTDPRIKISAGLTDSLIRQMEFGLLDREPKHLAIEILDDFIGDKSFELIGTLDEQKTETYVNEIMMCELLFNPEEWLGIKKGIYIPDRLTCKNCGAPIKSRYGCCDYCGGWNEWKVI